LFRLIRFLLFTAVSTTLFSNYAYGQEDAYCESNTIDVSCRKVVSGSISGIYTPLAGSGIFEFFAIIWIDPDNFKEPHIFARTYFGKTQRFPALRDKCRIAYTPGDTISYTFPYDVNLENMTEAKAQKIMENRPIKTILRAETITCEEGDNWTRY